MINSVLTDDVHKHLFAEIAEIISGLTGVRSSMLRKSRTIKFHYTGIAHHIHACNDEQMYFNCWVKNLATHQ